MAGDSLAPRDIDGSVDPIAGLELVWTDREPVPDSLALPLGIDHGVLLLTPEQQAGMVEDAPEIFSPVPGGWGLKGSTRVHLGSVTPDVLESALHTAWQLRLASNSKSKPRKKQRTSPER